MIINKTGVRRTRICMSETVTNRGQQKQTGSDVSTCAQRDEDPSSWRKLTGSHRGRRSTETPQTGSCPRHPVLSSRTPTPALRAGDHRVSSDPARGEHAAGAGLGIYFADEKGNYCDITWLQKNHVI